MRKRTFENQSFYRPEEQLRFFSMTQDIQATYVESKNNNCKWDIEPWKNQHQNPSESPQRRKYQSRPAPPLLKIQKPVQIKFSKPSVRVLQPTNNSNNSFRVKTNNKKHSTITQPRNQRENKPQILGTLTQRRQSSTSRNSTPRQFQRQRERQKRQKQRQNKKYEQDNQDMNYVYQTPVNMIVYPMVTENKKKRLFRKMDKFQNFVSVSLRK